jgi:hypothetical protein
MNNYLAYDFVNDHAVVPWELHQRPAWMPDDADYFTEVLREVDTKTSGLTILITWTLDFELPHTDDNMVVILLNDELGLMPRYAHDVRLLCRTYASVRPAVAVGPLSSWPSAMRAAAHEVRLQARRLPYAVASSWQTVRHHRRPLVLHVPVGLFQQMNQPFVPFAQRQYDASFIGSAELDRRHLSIKARSRRDLMEAAQLVTRTRPDIDLMVSTITNQPWELSEDLTSGYASTMMQSRIALCPRGSSLETYRFFEALKFGCVPITEPLPKAPFYHGSPAVQLRHWSRLPRVLDHLLSDRDALEHRHQAALEWWETRCSPAAVARSIVETLGVQRQQATVRAVP